MSSADDSGSRVCASVEGIKAGCGVVFERFVRRARLVARVCCVSCVRAVFKANRQIECRVCARIEGS